MAHLALRNELGHGADGVLDRHGRVDAMLVVEIDDIDAEPLQARVAGLDNVVRTAVDPLAGGGLDLAEFGGEHDAVAAALEGAAQHLLVMAPAIHVRGIEEIDAAVDGVLDDGDAGLVVGLAVNARERHTAEPDRRDLRAALAEPAMLHDSSTPWLYRHDDLAEMRVGAHMRLRRHGVVEGEGAVDRQ